MKVIGIEIDKKRAICIIAEKNLEGAYFNRTTKTKFIELKDDTDSVEIQNFLGTIHEFFDKVEPNKIAIISRQTKGKFSAASVSFKVEALIQCYQKSDICFVSKQTLSAYYKKNVLSISFDNAYQENATKLAQYLLVEK